VLFRLRAETQLIHMVNDFAQVVAALNLVLNLTKNFTNLVFDSVWPSRLGFEAVEIRHELQVDEIAQVIAGHGGVVIQLAVLPFRRGPGFPAIRLVENVGVFFAGEFGFSRLILLQPVEIFQKEQP
jgi:hypothetical protein